MSSLASSFLEDLDDLGASDEEADEHENHDDRKKHYNHKKSKLGPIEEDDSDEDLLPKLWKLGDTVVTSAWKMIKHRYL